MKGKLRGKVVDGTGHGVAEATVVILKAPGPVPDIAAVSDESGRFSFGEMQAGRYRLKAQGPDSSEGEDDVTVPPERALITLGEPPDDIAQAE